MKNTPSRFFATAVLCVALASCGTQRNASKTDEAQYDDYTSVDTAAYTDLGDSAVLPSDYDALPLRPAYTLVNDVVNTKLDVRFDWDKQYLYGKEWITLKPHFYPTDSLSLDAKGMVITKVELTQPTAQKLLYTYDDQLQLKIALNKTYNANEPYTVYIEYTARPDSVKQEGSAAITEAKGLYFINPTGADKGKPRQVWTQGETESNSAWFPTIDKPNAKTTVDLSMTVDTGLVTLSNGLMTSSKKNADGTRTDTWKSDKPFSTYLVMMAAGKFAVVKDKWKNLDVNYYVDPEYKPYAKEIFGNTPEMLSYYSNAFGVEYPWQKFSQVVVHDFVSGAMENVSAVVHYDALQETHRELIDENHEDIICHELSHHWFGDLVTAETWSQIPLNESFATYNEYLWLNHKYGNDEASDHIEQDLQQYLAEAQNKQVPLIRYRYNAREDLFDAHSYQKGGRVLYMLNKYVGDDAYFAALKLYLTQHQYGNVETDDLREAFEQVTGQDLRWFFDQWFWHAGHPVVNIQTDYDAGAHAAVVTMTQTPSTYSDAPDHWRLPMAVDVYTNSGKKRYNVVFDSLSQTFTFPAFEKPLLVNVDADKALLWQKTESKTADEYLYQYEHAPLYMDRFEALAYFAQNQGSEATATDGIVKALDDKYWSLRRDAVDALDLSDQMLPRVKDKLTQMAQRDPRSLVRAQALTKLSSLKDSSMLSLFTNALKDSSYAVVATGLSGVYELAPTKALPEAKKLMNEKSSTVAGAVMYVLTESGDSTLHPYFVQHIQSASSGDKFSAVMTYGKYLSTLSFNNTRQHLNELYDLAANDPQWFIRYAAVSALYDVRQSWSESADAIGQSLASLNSGDPQYNALKQQLQNRKDAVADIERRIGEMKKHESNDMLKAIMND